MTLVLAESQRGSCHSLQRCLNIYCLTSAGYLPCEGKGLHSVFSLTENERQATISVFFSTLPLTFLILLIPTVGKIS